MIPGDKMFEALKSEETIVLACNTRITKGVLNGIFRAAKEMDAAVIFELAKSESDLSGGYTGLTPQEYAKRVKASAKKIGHDVWLLHADHITVKNGTPEEIDDIKKLIMAQIDSGYTSFAIDASYLFNLSGKSVSEELAENIRVTTELARFIQQNMEESFGLEVEVGEIGRKSDSGLVLTTPEEAVTFIKGLARNGIEPNLLAIANGSSHGNTYDSEGNLIEQASIDIEQTIAVGKALEDAGFDVRIAQHGITGTPVRIIKEEFPKRYIRKGNVGTHWQNIVWEILEKEEPVLFRNIWDWTLAKYSKPGKKDIEVFGKNSKQAIKVFFREIDTMKSSTERLIEQRAYEDAKIFFDAFNAVGTAQKVRGAI